MSEPKAYSGERILWSCYLEHRAQSSDSSVLRMGDRPICLLQGWGVWAKPLLNKAENSLIDYDTGVSSKQGQEIIYSHH